MITFTVSGLTNILGQLLPEPHAGLLAGLLFGTKSSLPHAFYDALVRTGTLHIVALSGMNIAIMSRLARGSLVWMVGRRIASLLTILLILFFVWFVGPSASIVRAAIMGCISLFALLFGRQYWALGSWILAVGGMILINFALLGYISFQLSVLATLGIILFCDRDRDAFHESVYRTAGSSLNNTQEAAIPSNARPPISHLAWDMVKDDLRLTLAAQVFTVPVILFHFQRISLIAPIANLAIGWIIAPLTGLGWITVFVGFVSLPLARVFAWFDWVALEYIVRTIYIISSFPFASIGR